MKFSNVRILALLHLIFLSNWDVNENNLLFWVLLEQRDLESLISNVGLLPMASQCERIGTITTGCCIHRRNTIVPSGISPKSLVSLYLF